MRYLLTIFITVFLAELGDKTQFAVLLYATRPEGSKVAVAVAASLALVSTTVIAVLVGDRLSHWINPKVLEGAAAVGFIAIGIFMLVSFLRQP
ncbi:MAG: TMEM165/GDT1 family protein [Candidatus Marinimicrobia bacterium]|nr:TMEM165/GDT1 family protein [Candidatus Neomarinimicrobiota bacterium]